MEMLRKQNRRLAIQNSNSYRGIQSRVVTAVGIEINANVARDKIEGSLVVHAFQLYRFNCRNVCAHIEGRAI